MTLKEIRRRVLFLADADPSLVARAAEELLELVRSDGYAKLLEPLFRSRRHDVVRAAAWIAADLPDYRIAALLPSIVPFMLSSDRRLRFYAVKCAIECQAQLQPNQVALVARLLMDVSGLVRKNAMGLGVIASRRLKASLKFIRSPTLRDRIEWLSSRPTPNAIMEKLTSNVRIDRLVAASATQTHHSSRLEHFLSIASDPDVAQFIESQLVYVRRLERWRRRRQG